VGIKTLFIEPGSPWENGYIESFNGKLRDELLNVEIFDTLLEAKVLIERWRREYNTFRPHSSLGYCPPAPAAILPLAAGSATLRSPPREEFINRASKVGADTPETRRRIVQRFNHIHQKVSCAHSQAWS
jgi:hypothetical protein